MNEITIGKNISALRKKRGITQEALAAELSVTPQAVSKWETDTCLPDTQTLPLIAAFFDVSIDYLFYGEDVYYSDLYDKIFRKVASSAQMSDKNYKEAHTVLRYAHHGISCGNLRSMKDGSFPGRQSHITGKYGVSVHSPEGFGALVTRDFFERCGTVTADFGAPLLEALSDRGRLLCVMAVLSMSEISFGELGEKTGLSDEELREALDRLIEKNILTETVSKHKSLGFTYTVNIDLHSTLCILIATLEVQRESYDGITCCMGYGDFPISFE